MICKVIVSVSNKNVDKLYDYNVPPFLMDSIEVGQRILVPFGPRIIDAYVVSICDDTDITNLKDIIDIIDIEPLLTDEILSLIKPLSVKYCVSMYSIISLFIPNITISNLNRVLYINNKENLNAKVKDLFTNDTLVLTKKYQKYYGLLKKEINNNNLLLKYEFKNKVNDKFIKIINYKTNYTGSSKKAYNLLEYIKNNKNISLNELKESNLYSDSSFKTLENNGCITINLNLSYRRPYIIKEDDKIINLSDDQIKCINKVDLDNNQVYLLHGVTNSGKTEVYLKLMEKALKMGKSSILLVPEIALTTQLAMRAYTKFKDEVAIIHSKLSLGERFDEYRRIKSGKAHIIIGPRSAIFSSVKDLGLIIIDEEHSSSYISQDQVLYSAIEVAKSRAVEYDIPLILGSATPDISDYYKAETGEYVLLELPNRVNNIERPEVDIVDMRLELLNHNSSMISNKLKLELDNTLNNNKQALIYLNKRGKASAVMCRTCGYVKMCPHCNVPLTYHNNDILKCHLCGYEAKNVPKCPHCNSDKIRYVGTGTEKICEELNKLYPNKRILRLDSDNIKHKNDYEKYYLDFINHKYDILVGTEMITKGLDFKDVTLIGVINADLAFYHPSYDSIFVGYALLEQAIGRAGRHLKGKAIIQTYNPKSKVFNSIINNDYKEFYNLELDRRRKLNNPPFTYIKYIKFSSKDRIAALSVAKELVLKFNDKDIIVLGPSEDINFKIGNIYNFIVHFKYKNDNIINELNDYIKNINNTNIVIKVGDM